MKQKLKKKDKEVVSSGPWYQQNLHILHVHSKLVTMVMARLEHCWTREREIHFNKLVNQQVDNSLFLVVCKVRFFELWRTLIL